MRFSARFPLRLGGHDPTFDIEHQALLDELAPGWDVAPKTALNVEAHADALAVTMVWAINRRVGNQGFPLKMLESLRDWEDATKLRPAPDETLVERRRRVAAKLRGITNNALADLEDAASKSLGPNFDDLITIADANTTSYWPGVNPGPPGYEFSSNRAHIAIRMNANQLSDIELRRKVAALADALDHMRPAWLTFQIGVGSDGFMVGKDLLGLDML